MLVERVEKLCGPDWMRAFHEINAFERQLVRNGAIVARFWLAITPEKPRIAIKSIGGVFGNSAGQSARATDVSIDGVVE